jgi:hypothetical protein
VWAGQDGPATDGMREWSQMTWYDMAAFAIAQQRCCASPPKLKSDKLTPVLRHCDLNEALAGLVAVVLTGDDEAVDAAVDDYTKTVRCLARADAAQHFGYAAGLSGGEITFFKRFLARVRQSR